MVIYCCATSFAASAGTSCVHTMMRSPSHCGSCSLGCTTPSRRTARSSTSTRPSPSSGKSTTLGLISFLVPRCVSSVEISEAALYRAIELWQPCFVIDEFDSVLASEDKSALRSIINSGHTRGQGVIRCVEPDLTPRLFKTFCPKAIGMVGRKLPATTLGRCIIVELRRRKTNEPIERFAHKDDAELAELRSRLARWAVDNQQALRDAKTPMPEAFDNRRADNWRVLLAIADLAGEDWAEKARLAAGQLEGASDTSSIGVRLLTDIKRIFDEDGRDCILSALLVDRLVEVLFCDLPQIPGAMGRFVVTLLAAVAELEAGLIGERTKAALAAAKARGVRLRPHRRRTRPPSPHPSDRARRATRACRPRSYKPRG